MKSGTIIGLVLFGSLSVLTVDSVQAQRQYRRYTPPAGPTLTPQLNLLRSDTGFIGDPYNTFVVPRRQLDNQLSYMAKQEQADVRANRQQLEQIGKSLAAPTGSGATFMNYSHYYRMSAPNGANTRAR